MASEESPMELVCTLCNDIFKEPRILPCLHTFCHDCIAKQTQRFQTHANCFLCHADFSPGNKTGSAFRPDTYIASHVELYKLKTGEKMCVLCQLRNDQKQATHYCVECCDMLCSTCAEHHPFTKLTFEHQIVTSSDIRGGKYDNTILQKRLLTCSEHPCIQLKYYCRSCYSPVCELCLGSHEKDHEIVSKHEALNKSKAKEIDRMCSELQPRLRQIMSVQQIVTNGIEETKVKEKDIPRKIQSVCDKLKNHVRTNGTEAKQKASLELSNIKQKLLTQKSDVDRYLENLEPSLKTCGTFVSCGNTLHILPIADTLLKKLSVLATIEWPSDNVEKQTLNVECKSSLKEAMCKVTLKRTDVRLTNEGNIIEAESVPIRSLFRQALTHSTSDEQNASQLGNGSVQSPSVSKVEKLQPPLIDINTKPKTVTGGKTKSHISIAAKTDQNAIGKELQTDSSTEKGEDEQTDLACQEVQAKQATTKNENNSNQIGVEDDRNSSPKGKQNVPDLTAVSKYELVRCFSLETLADSRKPVVTSIAWVGSNSFVVSDMDNNKVTVFNTNGTVEWSAPINDVSGVACVKDVIACSRKGYITLLQNKNQTKNIKMQRGSITPLLTRTVDKTFLGTTSYDRNSLETFSTSGESIAQIQIRGCNVNMISSNDEWHIVSDWAMNSLFFIDKTSGKIVREAKLPEPLKLWGHHGGNCTDDNSILVADYYGQKIIVLTKDGRYLHSWSLPAAIYHPVDLDFHGSGQLVVTGKHHVAIFAKRLNKK